MSPSLEPPRDELRARFEHVRRTTDALAAPLSAEDMQLQSMPDASPTKWHLGHTSWFFEEFVLSARSDHRPFDSRYRWLFNSYFDAVGDRHARPLRGVLSRPTRDEIAAYRWHVDEQLTALLAGPLSPELRTRLELGLHHEAQHQELLLADILHAFSLNPLYPAYKPSAAPPRSHRATVARWVPFEGGRFEQGAPAEGFAFDNERPRHRVYIEPFALRSRLVTNAEYAEFIADGGYRRPELWLWEGFALVCEEGWEAPLYWRRESSRWLQFGLDGLQPLQLDAPVSCVSLFETDAYARWAKARLPTESEWELAAARNDGAENLLEGGALRALPATRAEGLTQMIGDLWEWTSSSYAPYPGFAPLEGALGEYNGKFMCNQYVLRGGSFATPKRHIRNSYRNFFPARARWQFTGIRLAHSFPP